jgi:hypothetical protein
MNGGTLQANCGPAVCVINGNLAMATAAALATQPSTGGGVLSVSGDAALAGTLDLNFSGLPVLPSYEIMTYSSETGTFSAVDATGLNSNEKRTLEYGPTSLVALISTPEPSSGLLLAAGLLAWTFISRHKLAESTPES